MLTLLPPQTTVGLSNCNRAVGAFIVRHISRLKSFYAKRISAIGCEADRRSVSFGFQQ
jgi:hypothetical protein